MKLESRYESLPYGEKFGALGRALGKPRRARERMRFTEKHLTRGEGCIEWGDA